MGAYNSNYCVLLSLALWIEKWIKDGKGAASQWLFCDGTTDSDNILEEQEQEAKNGKDSYGKYLATVLRNACFEKDGPGHVGTHSIKKYGTTRARRAGAPKDDVDYRARWRLKRQQEKYADIQLDWPDVNVACKLCDGGPLIYKEKDSSGITDEWLAREIAPGISGSFGNQVGAILAKSLLWACFDASVQYLVPADIRHRVIAKYILLGSDVADGDNPIEQTEVVSSENNGSVSIDECQDELEEGTGGTGTRGTRVNWNQAQWMSAIYAKVSSIQS